MATAPAKSPAHVDEPVVVDWRDCPPVELTELLRHASEAFYEQGYHGTTVRDIAARVGVTVPALYYHHENKAAILVAVLNAAMADLLIDAHHHAQAARATGAGHLDEHTLTDLRRRYLGAYTAGILNAQFGWSVYACIVLGALASVIAGLVLALPALRVRGPYFGLTTLVAVLMLRPGGFAALLVRP